MVMRLKRSVFWIRRQILWIAIGGLLFGALNWLVPPWHLPWRALNLNHPVGFATGTKLAGLNLVPRSWCAAILDDAVQLKIASIAPRRGPNDCGWSHAYQLVQSNNTVLRGMEQYPMNCPLVAASHLWLREVQLIASEQFGKAVTKIHHAGTYSCRRKYGRSSGSLSEHAYANAWDVTIFELRDGRVISIRKHWSNTEPTGQFLRDVRDRGCSLFNVVLSPDYNAAHHDHLHLDMGPFIACR